MIPLTFEHVQRLTLAEGDRLVLVLDHEPSKEESERLRAALAQDFPNNGIAVLSHGMELQVERDDDADELPPALAVLAKHQTRCGFCPHLIVAGEDLIVKIPPYGWIHEYCVDDAREALAERRAA